MIRKIMVLAVALLAIGGTVSAYSWWDTLQETQSETLTIGEGVDLVLNVTAAAPAGKVLIPAGNVVKVNDVTSIVLEYTVNLDQAALAALTLSVSESNVLIGGVATNAGLVNIAISAGSTVNDTAVPVTVTVTLTEPADEATYNAIVNGLITFDLTFSAS